MDDELIMYVLLKYDIFNLDGVMEVFPKILFHGLYDIYIIYAILSVIM